MRIAESQLRQSELSLELLLRQERSEIRGALLALRASIAQEQSAREALRSAEEGYRIQLGEYRLGLVNNLDVIAAMNSLLGTRRSFHQVAYESKLNLIQLKVSTEDLP